MNQSMIQKRPLASHFSLYDSNEEKAKQDTEYQPQQIENENDEQNDHFEGEFSFEKLIMETHQIKEAMMEDESESEDIQMWESRVKQESNEEGQYSFESQSPVEVNYHGQITSKIPGNFSRRSQGKKIQKRNQKAKLQKSLQQKSCRNEIMPKTQNSNPSSKYSKRISNRKIRTTVSQEKIKIMQHLFPYIQKCIPYKGTTLSLKDVAKIVNLGYSTILHKYKDYRKKGQVEKGLLLKFKDVKRKYGKSLVIQNAIKCALAQRTFKTAKQLAAYIRETNHMNVNRSIISRHLNQMQREKQEYLVEKEISESQTEEIQQQLSRQLKNFSKLYFGFKEKQFKCFYFSVIRLYFVGGKLLEELGDDNRKAYEIINLAVTSTQDQLVNYYPNVEIMEEMNDMAKRRGFTAESTYKTLYDEVINKIQEESMVEHVPGNEKTYVLFPYRWDLQKQYEYRKKVLKPFLAAKLNLLVTPPRLNGQDINFIQIWVQNEVLPKLKDVHFEGIEQMKEELLHTMNHSQKRLRKYANEMAFNIKKFQ